MSFKVLAVAAMVLLAGCTSSTRYGDCVGVLEDKDPTLAYSADVGNIVLGILFFETVVVPAVVVLAQLECPTGTAAPGTFGG